MLLIEQRCNSQRHNYLILKKGKFSNKIYMMPYTPKKEDEQKKIVFFFISNHIKTIGQSLLAKVLNSRCV